MGNRLPQRNLGQPGHMEKKPHVLQGLGVEAQEPPNTLSLEVFGGSLEENRRVAARADGCACRAAGLERENARLHRRLKELALRLRQLNRVLRAVQELSGEAMDIVEVPDPLLKPWQLPCASQPITASSRLLL
ncbi:bZIP transcription factor 53-like [Wolffia australiana]